MRTKTYEIFYAEDVPHYATGEIEAGHDGEAIARALAHPWSNEASEPDWDSAVNRRIVSIEDPDGKTVASDIPLDPQEATEPDLPAQKLYEALVFARDELEHLRERCPGADDTALRERIHSVEQAISQYEGGAS